ncbi:hypothetical protein T484DRAFT_1776994 [Baffinella frigidus]|nr:hypothetical protein T484DRAFT_1776994 [Cryptophyta sp. CCMP2293]
MRGGTALRRVLAVALLLQAAVPAGGDTVAERCARGLALHGRGQWGSALEVFAAAVGDALAAGLGSEGVVEDAVDCTFGAALSLNVLGESEAALSAFRLSQRLLTLHPRGVHAASHENAARCKAIAEEKSSAPYMSCDSVRAAADLFHDAFDGVNCRFHPDAVPDGSVIFVNALLLADFAVNKAPFIRSRRAARP